MSEIATLTLDWPDSFVPVYGFRAWRFHNTHRGVEFPLMLRNVSGARSVWWDSTSWTFASCSNPVTGMWGGQPRCPGPVPNFDCECGLYAYHHAMRVRSYLGQYVVGAVAGQGMTGHGVIRHGREGWRAEMAKPIAFVKPVSKSQSLRPVRGGVQRYYSNISDEVPGMIERLAYRLEAKLFDTIEDMEDWVKYDSGYECFWTPEDEARFQAQYDERMTP
jgi:hypothetical protein